MVYIEAIQEIDPKLSTTGLIFQVIYFWADPRVAKACEQDPLFRVPLDLWKPGLQIANGISEQRAVHRARRGRH
jgi:hypothetical protein